MKPNEITEGNKLIAEFMGLKIITDEISFFDTNYKPLRKYHSDWNGLMPVVEKIEGLLFKVGINRGFCDIDSFTAKYDYHLQIGLKETKIQAVWLAVVDFIKWYNQNK